MLFSANVELIEAIIELFGAVVTLVLGIMFVVMTGRKHRSEKLLFALLMLATLNLILDATWYLMDGDTSQTGIILNRIANLLIFVDNALMIFSIAGYIKSIIYESGGTPKKIFLYISRVFGNVVFLMPLINLGFPWMYNFTSQNQYFRMDGWYAYTAVNALAMINLIIMVIYHRHQLSKNKRFTLYFLLFAPFIGTAIQAFSFGISFVQMGIALGALIAVGGYITDWIFAENKKGRHHDRRRHFWVIEGAFLIMVLFITGAVASNVVSVVNVSQQQGEQSSKAVAHMISEKIEATVCTPIDVSRTMSKASDLRQALAQGDIVGTSLEKGLVKFLKNVQDEYDFQMVFAVSDKTRAVYSYEGLSRYMNVAGDPNEAWYKDFWNKKINYEINIDDDKDTNMERAVFVNMEVLDDNFHRIGVCGVGMSLDKMVGLMAEYEKQYDLKIYMIDTAGLVKLSTNKSEIDNRVMDISALNQMGTNDFTYSRNYRSAILTRYMENMRWYIVIEDNNPDKINALEIISPSLTIYIFGLVLIIGITMTFGIYEKRRRRQLTDTKVKAETDALTGLLNRYSMEKYLDEIERIGIPEQFTIAMFDVNELKEVNDNIGHMAGDELLEGTAKCCCDIFGDYGKIFRIGGDEFLVICQCTKKTFGHLIDDFKFMVKNWEGKQVKELSISIGTASHEEFPEYSIDQLRREADTAMYQQKAEFYAQEGKDRRKKRI